MNKKTNKFLALFLAFIMVFASPLQTIIYANYGPPDSAYEQEKQEEDSSYISDFYDDEESEDGNLYEKPEDIDSDQFPPDLESDDLTNQLKGIQVNITDTLVLQPGTVYYLSYVLIDEEQMPYFGLSEYKVTWNIVGEVTDGTFIEDGRLEISELEPSGEFTVELSLYIHSEFVETIVVKVEIAEESEMQNVEVENIFSPFADNVIFQMSEYLEVQEATLGTNLNSIIEASTILDTAGAPLIAVEATTGDHNAVRVSDRSQNWHGIDILIQDSSLLRPGERYRVTWIGRRDTDTPANAAISLGLADNGWPAIPGGGGNVAANMAFERSWEFDFGTTVGGQPVSNFQYLRIQAAVGITSFILEDIVIEHLGSLPSFYELSVNGEPGVTSTTEITLSFLRDIYPNLELSHIDFEPRMTGAEVVELRKEANDEYVLVIENVQTFGVVQITIQHEDVNNATQSIMLYHDTDIFIPNRPLRPYFPHIHDPNFANLMPSFDHLMDPFQFFGPLVGEDPANFGTNGRVETAEDWLMRREEIRDLIMYYYYGFMWPTTANNVTVNTEMRPYNNGSINITVDEYRLDGTPTTATGNVATAVFLPTFEQLAANGFWDLDTNTGTGGPLIIGTNHTIPVARRNEFLERGIGVLTTANVPGNEQRTGMYFNLFPFDPTITEYNTGTLMANSWIVSRVIDAFELNPEWGVNPNAIATLGNSFAGKRALFAGVMDDRVALTIPHESGGDGGVAPFRFSHAGRINFYNDNGVNRVHSRHETTRNGNAGRGAMTVANFFRENAEYEDSIHLMPFDMHLAIALTAGENRAFLSLETDSFGTWTGWGPARTVAEAANEVFQFLGYDNLAFRQKRSGHAIHDTDYPVIYAIFDSLFGNPVHGTSTGFRGNRQANQVYVEDMLNVALPGVHNSIGELGRSPLEVESSWMPWSRPGVHTLWTTREFVTEGHPALITAYTDAQTVELILWTHGDGNTLMRATNPPIELNRWSTTVADGVATFELDYDEVKIGRYELRAIGTLESRSAFFQGIDPHTALRSGPTRDNIGAHVMLGFTSRINPDIEIYTTASGNRTHQTSVSTAQSVEDFWIMPYGIRAINIPGTGDNRFYTLKNVNFEAMPSFTFEISFQENMTTGGWPVADQPPYWGPSIDVQNIGPYPHWMPGGTGSRPDGTSNNPHDNRASNFDIELTHSLDNNIWTIDFSAPVNPRDFGIGFNFGESFSLDWNDDSTKLEITFNGFDPLQGQELSMYIMRLTTANSPITTPAHGQLAQAINSPIHYVITYDETDSPYLYSLASDSYVQDLAIGTTGESVISSPNLSQSGTPTFTIVENSTGNNSISVSGRNANHYALDLLRVPLGLELGTIYTISISGHIDNAPAGTQVIIGGASNPWNWIANAAPDANGYFEVTARLNYEWLEQSQVANAFRIQTNNTASFVLDSIVVAEYGPDPDFTPPLPPSDIELPDGEIIYSLAGDGYFQALTLGEISGFTHAYLERSGGANNPILTIINHPKNGNSLAITDRTATWHSLDVILSAMSLQVGAEYTIVVQGRSEGNGQITLTRPEAPWSDLTSVPIDTQYGTFRIDHVLTEAQLNEILTGAQPGVRIGATVDVDIIIDDIFVIRTEDAPLNFITLHHITFDNDNWDIYEDYIAAGAQMSGMRVTNHGNSDNYSFRLENITGDFMSGNGNYLRFDLPGDPIPIGTVLRVSWDVYVPSDLNPIFNTNLRGPSMIVNSAFGNLLAEPSRPVSETIGTPVDQWVTTSVEFVIAPEVGDVTHFIFRYWDNTPTGQPHVLFIDNIIIEYGGDAGLVIPEWDLTLPSLAEAFSDFFLFGNIYSTTNTMNISNTREAFSHHFNAVTAENWHKPDHIAQGTTRPDPANFNFSQVDNLVNWAVDNDIALIGHALVWHSQKPAWLTDAGNATRAEARANMEFYIRTLAEHYESIGLLNAFYSWDVVNEVIASGGGTRTGDWRDQIRTGSQWLQAYSRGYDATAGEHPTDFIYDAFVFARRYFPNSILYYNDYNEEIPNKRDAIAEMVEYFNARWAHDSYNNPEAVPSGEPYDGRLLIEGIGMQSHYHMEGWTTNLDNVRPAIERFIATGARVSITELDITFGGFGSPAHPELTPEQLEMQAAAFERLFGYYLEFYEYIYRVSIWGLIDSQSWRATGHPLLFDADFAAKPAFFAIHNALETFLENSPPEEPIVTSVVITPTTATIDRSTTRQFSVTIEGTGDFDESVTWYVNSVDSVSISEVGLLTVGANVSVGTALTVRAVSVANNDVYDEVTITVTAPSITPPPPLTPPPTSPTVPPSSDDTRNDTISNGIWIPGRPVQTQEISKGQEEPTETESIQVPSMLIPTPWTPGNTPPEEIPTFNDITENSWYAPYVTIVTSAGLFQGDGQNFNPNQAMTRAMFVQVLANLEGVDLSELIEFEAFTDVDSNAWYSPAVAWAYSLGIVSGVGGGRFAPDNEISREEIAVMIYRFIQIMEIELLEISHYIISFSDTDEISPWAIDAVVALTSLGLIEGRTSGDFAPHEVATRAEVATIFARFLQNFE